jgi:hypothetical protein
MLDDLADLYKDREERVKHGKTTLVIKQWDGSDKDWIFEDGKDIQWRLIVACVFRENGKPAFDKNDLEAIKKKPLISGPLAAAVGRVNSLNLEEEVKNSEAAQG